MDLKLDFDELEELPENEETVSFHSSVRENIVSQQRLTVKIAFFCEINHVKALDKVRLWNFKNAAAFKSYWNVSIWIYLGY